MALDKVVHHLVSMDDFVKDALIKKKHVMTFLFDLKEHMAQCGKTGLKSVFTIECIIIFSHIGIFMRCWCGCCGKENTWGWTMMICMAM